MYVDVLCVCEEKTIRRYLRFVTHQVICQPGTTLKSTRETGAHFLYLTQHLDFIYRLSWASKQLCMLFLQQHTWFFRYDYAFMELKKLPVLVASTISRALQVKRIFGNLHKPLVNPDPFYKYFTEVGIRSSPSPWYFFILVWFVCEFFPSLSLYFFIKTQNINCSLGCRVLGWLFCFIGLCYFLVLFCLLVFFVVCFFAPFENVFAVL